MMRGRKATAPKCERPHQTAVTPVRQSSRKRTSAVDTSIYAVGKGTGQTSSKEDDVSSPRKKLKVEAVKKTLMKSKRKVAEDKEPQQKSGKRTEDVDNLGAGNLKPVGPRKSPRDASGENTAKSGRRKEASQEMVVSDESDGDEVAKSPKDGSDGAKARPDKGLKKEEMSTKFDDGVETAVLKEKERKSNEGSIGTSLVITEEPAVSEPNRVVVTLNKKGEVLSKKSASKGANSLQKVVVYVYKNDAGSSGTVDKHNQKAIDDLLSQGKKVKRISLLKPGMSPVVNVSEVHAESNTRQTSPRKAAERAVGEVISQSGSSSPVELLSGSRVFAFKAGKDYWEDVDMMLGAMNPLEEFVKFPHPSLARDSSMLKPLIDKEAVGKMRMYCPLCPKEKWLGRKFRAIMCHLLSSHFKYFVACGAYRICVCHMDCTSGSNARGHFHCPMCGRSVVRKEEAVKHVNFACKGIHLLVDKAMPDRVVEDGRALSAALSSFRGAVYGPNPNRHLIQIDNYPGVRNIQLPYSAAAAGADNDDDDGNDDADTLVLAEDIAVNHPHPSVITAKEALRMTPCDRDTCRCHRYHCRLCDQATWRVVAQADTHLHVASHTRRAVTRQGHTMLMCQLSQCVGERSGGGRGNPHWHCPRCGRVFLKRGAFNTHLASVVCSHDPAAGTVVEQTGSEVACVETDKTSVAHEAGATEPRQSAEEEPRLTADDLLRLPYVVRDLEELQAQLGKCDGLDCDCGGFHCPLCPPGKLKIPTLERSKMHLMVHQNNNIRLKGGIYLLQCKRECSASTKYTTPRSGGHYHCPVCDKIFMMNLGITYHIRESQCSVRHFRDVTEETPEDDGEKESEAPSVGEDSAISRSEVKSTNLTSACWEKAQVAIGLPTTKVPCPHPSIITKTLHYKNCPSCRNYHCPLCPPGTANTYYHNKQEITRHADMHTRQAVTYQGVHLLCCNLPCVAELKHYPLPHYHCHKCGDTMHSLGECKLHLWFYNCEKENLDAEDASHGPSSRPVTSSQSDEAAFLADDSAATLTVEPSVPESAQENYGAGDDAGEHGIPQPEEHKVFSIVRGTLGSDAVAALSVNLELVLHRIRQETGVSWTPVDPDHHQHVELEGTFQQVAEAQSLVYKLWQEEVETNMKGDARRDEDVRGDVSPCAGGHSRVGAEAAPLLSLAAAAWGTATADSAATSDVHMSQTMLSRNSSSLEGPAGSRQNAFETHEMAHGKAENMEIVHQDLREAEHESQDDTVVSQEYETFVSHGDDIGSHGDDIGSHGDDIGSHGDDISIHGGDINGQSNAIGIHGDDIVSQVDAVGSHGDVIGSQGDDMGSQVDDIGSQKDAVGSQEVKAEPKDTGPDLDLEREVECGFCGKTTKNVSMLVSHLLEAFCWESHSSASVVDTSAPIREVIEAAKRIRQLKCPLCGRTSSTFSYALKHYIRGGCLQRGGAARRPQMVSEDDGTFLAAYQVKYDLDKRMYRCADCSVLCRRADRMRRHIESRHLPHTMPCPMCKRKVASDHMLQWHIKKCHVNRKRVVCHECGMSLSSNSLAKHIRVLHKVGPSSTPAKCPLCKYVGRNQVNLNRHFQSMHGEKSFICEFCGKGFGNRNNLDKHRVQVHIGSTDGAHPFMGPKIPCPQCNLKMYRKNLEIHIRVRHQNIRAFKCDTCGKPFGTKSGLDQHRETHNLDDNNQRVYRYKCKLCPRGFNRPSAYRIHMELSHTGGSGAGMGGGGGAPSRIKPCPVCGKRFRTDSVLLKHVVLHEDDGRRCDICDKTFSASKDLKIHMSRAHNMKGQFVCSCGLKFWTETAYTTHKPRCLQAGGDRQALARQVVGNVKAEDDSSDGDATWRPSSRYTATTEDARETLLAAENVKQEVVMDAHGLLEGLSVQHSADGQTIVTGLPGEVVMSDGLVVTSEGVVVTTDDREGGAMGPSEVMYQLETEDGQVQLIPADMLEGGGGGAPHHVLAEGADGLASVDLGGPQMVSLEVGHEVVQRLDVGHEEVSHHVIREDEGSYAVTEGQEGVTYHSVDGITYHVVGEDEVTQQQVVVTEQEAAEDDDAAAAAAAASAPETFMCGFCTTMFDRIEDAHHHISAAHPELLQEEGDAA